MIDSSGLIYEIFVGLLVSMIIIAITFLVRKFGRRMIRKDTRKKRKSEKKSEEEAKELQTIKKTEEELVEMEQELSKARQIRDIMVLDQMEAQILLAEEISKRTGEFDSFLEKVFEIAEKKTNEDASYMFLPQRFSVSEKNDAIQTLQGLANRNICYAAKEVMSKQLRVRGGIWLTCCGYFVRLAIEICGLNIWDLCFENEKLKSIKFKRILRGLTSELRHKLLAASASERLIWNEECNSLEIKESASIFEFIAKKINETDYCDVSTRRDMSCRQYRHSRELSFLENNQKRNI